jgi:hypothetical protein
MKKLISLLTLIALIVFSIKAEEPAEQANELKPKSKSADKFMFTFTFDNVFHQENNGFATRWGSRGAGLHFMYDIPFKSSGFSVAPGLGFSHSSYYHNSFMVEDADGTRFEPIADFKENDDFKRHKLAVNFIELPVELRFRTKPNKAGNMWKLAAGFKAGFRLTAVNKEVRKENDYFKKFKTKGFRDVNQIRVGPTLRFGYGAFNVFAFYSVTGLFKNSNNLDMTPFAIGITICSF